MPKKGKKNTFPIILNKSMMIRSNILTIVLQLPISVESPKTMLGLRTTNRQTDAIERESSRVSKKVRNLWDYSFLNWILIGFKWPFILSHKIFLKHPSQIKLGLFGWINGFKSNLPPLLESSRRNKFELVILRLKKKRLDMPP